MATPTITSKREARTLPELVQSLPQELFDRIYEETFSWTAGPQDIVDGDGMYLSAQPDAFNGALTIAVNSRFQFAHPPTSLLRVDRSSRYKMLKPFYSNTVFAIFGTAGDPRAVVEVKERKPTPDRPWSYPRPVERRVFSSSFDSEEVAAFAGALFAPGLSRGLKWDGGMMKQGNVYSYMWSWEMGESMIPISMVTLQILT